MRSVKAAVEVKDPEIVKGTEQVIEVPDLNQVEMSITLKGATALIVQPFSEKTKKALLRKHTGEATKRKAPKDPKKEFENCVIPHPDGGFSFPTNCLMKLMLASIVAARDIKSNVVNFAVSFPDEFAQIVGKPTSRMDNVRQGRWPNMVTDIRTRAEFKTWQMKFRLNYIPEMITPAQILFLLKAGGMGNGLGEWRKERKGRFGLFTVSDVSSR